MKKIITKIANLSKRTLNSDLQPLILTKLSNIECDNKRNNKPPKIASLKT